MGPSVWSILVIGVVVVLLFGRGKISGLMGEVAKGINAFKKGMKEGESGDVAQDKSLEEGERTIDVSASEAKAEQRSQG